MEPTAAISHHFQLVPAYLPSEHAQRSALVSFFANAGTVTAKVQAALLDPGKFLAAAVGTFLNLFK